MKFLNEGTAKEACMKFEVCPKQLSKIMSGRKYKGGSDQKKDTKGLDTHGKKRKSVHSHVAVKDLEAMMTVTMMMMTTQHIRKSKTSHTRSVTVIIMNGLLKVTSTTYSFFNIIAAPSHQIINHCSVSSGHPPPSM